MIFATLARDRKVRLFKTATGKMWKVFDESLAFYQVCLGSFRDCFNEICQQTSKERNQLTPIEFNRRMAVERDLDKNSEQFALQRIEFDMSGNFLIMPSMLGIKLINCVSNELARVIGVFFSLVTCRSSDNKCTGKPETLRFLCVSVCRAMLNMSEKLQGAATSAEVHASENPALKVCWLLKRCIKRLLIHRKRIPIR